MVPMLMVLVLHMAVHDNTSGHLQLVCLRLVTLGNTYALVNITILPFVGEDYFCESGHNSGQNVLTFHSDDPLWDGDGDGCTASSTCCSFNNPPYQLPSPTTDDIEARLCHDESQGNEDTPIEFIELYIQ